MINRRDTERKSAGRGRGRIAIATLIAAAVPLVLLGASAVDAQSIMRTPNLNLGPRVPTISSGAVSSGSVSRVTPSVATAGPRVSVRINTVNTVARVVPRIAVVTPKLPYVRYPHNNYPNCDYVNRAAGGECLDSAAVADGSGSGTSGPRKRSQNNAARRNNLQAAVNANFRTGEIIAEIDNNQADAFARQHRLTPIGSQDSPVLGSSFELFRITDGRSVQTVQAELATDAATHSVQPNFRYVLQDQNSPQVASEGDPAQYALAKLRLPQAHALAHGNNVTVAVIDSGIDDAHPELAGAIADRFDALGSSEGPHVHGTGIAGAIVAHGKLMGGAPMAKILAIRAFGVARNGAESSSFVILKSLDYAVAHGAQIVNMSFAGPKDPLIERAVAATASKGIVLVAASGNAGPKSPPLYPAANPNVIAVSATDAADKLFAASNRGAHIAIAAPGVDIFLPAPGDKYQMTSGTSFSAAYVSAVAALLFERNPALKPEELRTILTRTARDLGAPGRDDLFGAGEADAFAAVSAVPAGPVPVAAAPQPSQAPTETQKVSVEQAVPATRALNEPAAAIASDKSAAQ